jgi:hypothetical protein
MGFHFLSLYFPSVYRAKFKIKPNDKMVSKSIDLTPLKMADMFLELSSTKISCPTEEKC